MSAAPVRAALVVAYDGARLRGWQRQAGAPTVQGLLEDALSRLVRAPVVVEGSGRTDAGAHATGQVAHADLDAACGFAPRGVLDAGRLRHRLNRLLPEDVRVLGVAGVGKAFHARKSAIGKAYRYRWRVAPTDLPLTRAHRVHVVPPLDVEAMREGAAHLVGAHDFAAFRTQGSSVRTTVRDVRTCEVAGAPPEVDLVMEGSGFLRHMVRAVAGTLLEVGRGRRAPSSLAALLAGGERGEAGANAPARGLALERVRYPQPWQDLLDAALGLGHDRARP